MALIFVRHGSTTLNAGDPADPRDYFRGWTDAPLSDFGRQTVAQTAAWLQHLPIQSVISSDLSRAKDTAEMIAQPKNLPIQVDPRLRPLHVGILTGQLIDDRGKKMLEYAHENKDSPIPGGESYNDFLNRYKSILPELLQAGQNQNVVVVSHHRNMLALPHIFFNKPTATKGPPVPGGAMMLTSKGLYSLFEPPAEAATKEKAAS